MDAAGLCARARCMADALTHRGPDDSGEWADPQVGIGLGFRRLAIVDLSPHGHQPMCSESGRYVVAYNGEIYNYPDLRRQLEPLGHAFRGHSDTEIMLAAIEEWGLQAAVRRFIGMFAFALWDRRDRRLSLVRDRLGIKPLYYGWMGGTFLYGSELKALRRHPTFQPRISRDALTLYMRYQCVPAPYSIYEGMRQLPPGSILTLSSRSAEDQQPTPYWSTKDVVESGHAHMFSGSDEEAIEQLDSLLRDAVKLRMVADVPLGAFLSGGVDSSTVVALMQAQSSRPVKTFSIGFHEAGFDEAAYAGAVARHLGTDHTELYVTPHEAQTVIPCLPDMYDEPFSDSSQIPTFLVSELTRRQVTVSLSGDGGDEVFAGYPRYFLGAAIWQKIRWLPPSLRSSAARVVTRFDASTYNRWLGSLNTLARRYSASGSVGDSLHKLAEVMAFDTQEAFYQRLISTWKDPSAVVAGGRELPTPLTDRRSWVDFPDFAQRMAYLDTVTYLPNDILTKVDRASMAVSLEARVPILDHRVVEYASRLPLHLKIRNGSGKWILRQVLYKYVPPNLIDRPKMGFGVPIHAWLRGSLRNWADELLSEQRLRDEGFLDPAPIVERWRQHLASERDWSSSLWTVLMFQAWLERWGR